MWISKESLQRLDAITLQYANIWKGQKKIMAEIDDLKTAVSNLTTSQAAFNAELSKTLADIQAKLGTPGISAADVEAAAQAIGGVVTAVDTNTATLTSFDASLNPAPPKSPTP